MRWGTAAFALRVSAVLSLTGCGQVLGIEDWDRSSAGGTGAATHSGAGAGAVNASSASGGGGGAGGSGGGAPEGPCGKTSLFADDFAGDGALGDHWVLPPPADYYVTQMDGNAVFNIDGNNYSYVEIDSSRYFDLTGDAVTVEIPEAPTYARHAELLVSPDYPTTNVLRIRADANVLTLESVVSSRSDLKQIAFDAMEHRFWRIRESEGSVYWETSEDGAMFVPQYSRLTSELFPVDVVRIDLAAGNDILDEQQASVKFGPVNGGQPKGVLCKTRALVDDFEDGAISPKWALSPPAFPCVATEMGGQLEMKPASNEVSLCAYVSASDFDLTGSSVSVELVQMLMSSMTGYQAIMAFIDTMNWVQLYERNGQLTASYTLDGSEHYEAVAFDHASHHFWRIRESAGTTFWEASGDGTVWAPVWQARTPLDVSRVQVVLTAGAEDEPNPGAVRFDNLNLEP